MRYPEKAGQEEIARILAGDPDSDEEFIRRSSHQRYYEELLGEDFAARYMNTEWENDDGQL